MKAGADSILPCQAEGIGLSVGDRQLVKSVSFTLSAGPKSVILGPNGAGKSLLLRLLHGLIAPDEGRVSWQRPAGARKDHARRRQAMVFQRPVLLRRSAAANVDYALTLHGIGGAEGRRRRDEALEKTGLAEMAGRQARVLSVGQQQRLALARAWALRPEVLFLDEPTASLDPAATLNVERVIEAMHGDGTKLIMTTHDLSQARRLADEVLFLHRGRLVEHRTAKAFFEAPESAEARAFLNGELVW